MVDVLAYRQRDYQLFVGREIPDEAFDLRRKDGIRGVDSPEDPFETGVHRLAGFRDGSVYGVL
jgi:hypothetical protein